MYRPNTGSRGFVAPRSQFRSFSRGRGRGMPTTNIHESKFIKKAAKTEVFEPYVSTLQFETLDINPILKANVLKKRIHHSYTYSR